MCAGDDHNCPQFELHRQKLLDDLDAERRSFLKSAFVAGGGAAALAAGGGALIQPASAQTRPGQPTYHYLPATADTVHWGYFSKLLKPQLEVDSGDYVTIEALTHHANDDAERMVKGDPGAESVFLWTKDKKGVNRRGAGPIDGKLLGRGAGEGFGVHICTGPVYIRGAEPGDILEVRIIDVKPRPCANPAYAGKSFGSNAAAWWGFHYKELHHRAEAARGLHHLRDRHQRAAQLGAGGLQFPLDAADRSVRRRAQDHRLSGRAGRPLDGAGEPRHPQERAHSDPPAFRRDGRRAQGSRLSSNSIPPGYFGGNMDNWRIGKGATMYYPGRGARRPVLGRRFPRLAGRFRTVRHRHRMLADRHLPAHPAQEERADRTRSPASTIRCSKPRTNGCCTASASPTISPSSGRTRSRTSTPSPRSTSRCKDAFRKMRAFLMTTKGLTEDEAISLISVAVDFGVTQVVDGNWGIHAIVKKSLFAGASA